VSEIGAQISTRMVSLLKEFAGRGPTQAKTYYLGDVVLILLGGGFTRIEETLQEAGQGQAVKDQRVVFQQAMRERFSAAIEEVTGRKVISFMNAIDQAAKLSAELFVLEPDPGSEVADVVVTPQSE
jgi:uncharacterized protein YbcI